MDRRSFLRRVSAGVAGAAVGAEVVPALAGSPSPRRTAAADELRVGVIGVGSRGQSDMQTLLRVPGTRVVALCDVYPPRFEQGRRIAGENATTHADYRRMLDERRRELDAVIVATPLRDHADAVVAALESGLHVYGEKSMSYDLAGARRIVDAVRRTGKSFQIGHQYRYAAWTREAVRRVKAGEIGEVTHVFAYWHRNNDWRRPLPASTVPGFTRAQLERLLNWRLYTEYSRGLLAELASHHIDIANWVFESVPHAALGSGAIVSYPDGRETFDTVDAVFEYPNGRRLTFSSLLNNRRMGDQLWIVGSKGSVEITLEDATFYFEPGGPERPAGPGAVRTGASLKPRGEMPYRGPGERVDVPPGQGSADLLAMTDFVESIRAGRRPWADERVGFGSAIPVIFADEATRAGARREFGQEMASAAARAGS